jgi:hypothetical protein
MNAQNTEQGGEQRIKPLTAKERKRLEKIADVSASFSVFGENLA